MRTTATEEQHTYRPVVGIAIASLLVCGLFFPFLITGLAQVLFPAQANGELVQLNGRTIGSELIAQQFSLPIFFHPRNDSGSGADPHISVQDAHSQIPRIASATGIPANALVQLVNQHVDETSKIFGNPYVNVLMLNLALVSAYPAVYGDLP